MTEEIHVNENNSAQSKLPVKPRLVPPEALLRLSEVVGIGAEKYAENNWRGISMEDHVDHALYHVFQLMNGDTSDDHLGHALCRLAFAVGTEKQHDFKLWRPLKNNGEPTQDKENPTTIQASSKGMVSGKRKKGRSKNSGDGKRS